ncbi:MAG: flagellar biosynthetic protein FliO [Betaproteobacteria bacterium]|nr:flagellar biosynthetic protein FliO [Betaproteobacteria bacterium]
MDTRLPHFILAAAAATPALAFAEGSLAASELGGGISQVVISLVLVVLLLIGSLSLLKRLSAPRGGAAGILRVIAGAAVGTRERVVLVEVGDTWLVLGVAPGSVTPLHQLPRQAQALAGDASMPGKDFTGWLKQVMDRRNAP